MALETTGRHSSRDSGHARRPVRNTATCPGFTSGPRGFEIPREGKLFLYVVLAEVVILIATSIAVLADKERTTPASVYAGLGIYCAVGFLYFAVDAVMFENKFQFYAANVASLLILFFLVWEAARSGTHMGTVWRDIRFEVVAIVTAFNLFYAGIFVKVKESFGYFSYKVVGALVALQRLYTRFRIFMTFLKGDLFFTLLLLLLAKAFLLSVNSIEFELGIGSFIVSLLFTCLGWFSVTNESTIALFAFAVISILQPAYLGYKLYALEVDRSLLPTSVSYAQFAVVGGCSIFVRASLLASCYMCYKGFGNGLREIVFKTAGDGDIEEGRGGTARLISPATG